MLKCSHGTGCDEHHKKDQISTCGIGKGWSEEEWSGIFLQLIHMRQLKHETLEQMLEMSGVGQVKLEKFGEVFLNAIRESRG
jgi:superfamily II DNA helicase RecQ